MQPAGQSSSELTVPNDDSTLANGSLTVRFTCVNLEVPPLCGAAGDQADVRYTATLNDVRCKPGHAAATSCGSANTSPGEDYTGKVLFQWSQRWTDHLNGGPGFTSTATMIDSDIMSVFGLDCTASPSDPS